jgi:hypothetical protein
MSDLRQRVPGHSLVDELLRQWDLGTIHVDQQSNGIVIDDEAVGWYRGVVGERRVAALLDELGDESTVLHSVPVGRSTSDIDHVVIGPAGVFTINTKYSPGKRVWVAGYGMYVDGHKQMYVRNSVNEAARASELLTRASGMTVPVIGLIVFVDPGSMTHKAAAGGGEYSPEIRVISGDQLLGAIRGRALFSTEQVARIAEVAVRPETWHSSPVTSTVGRHITQEFEALKDAVGPRLAQPVVRAPARVPRARAVSRPASRQQAPRNRRRQKSTLERLFAGLAGIMGPVVFLVIVWNTLNSHSGR